MIFEAELKVKFTIVADFKANSFIAWAADLKMVKSRCIEKKDQCHQFLVLKVQFLNLIKERSLN